MPLQRARPSRAASTRNQTLTQGDQAAFHDSQGASVKTISADFDDRIIVEVEVDRPQLNSFMYRHIASRPGKLDVAFVEFRRRTDNLVAAFLCADNVRRDPLIWRLVRSNNRQSLGHLASLIQNMAGTPS